MEKLHILCFIIMFNSLMVNITGLVCHTCSRSSSNTECSGQGTTLCSFNQGSCETEIRIENGIFSVEKRCKQTLACNNNALGNVINCVLSQNNPFCFYCCSSNHCNLELPSNPLVTDASTGVTNSSETTEFDDLSSTTPSLSTSGPDSTVDTSPASSTSTSEEGSTATESSASAQGSNVDDCQSGEGTTQKDGFSTTDVLIILGIITLTIFGAIQCCFMAVVGVRWIKNKKEDKKKSLVQQEDIESSSAVSQENQSESHALPSIANFESQNHMYTNGHGPLSHKINGVYFKQDSIISNGDSARLITISPTTGETYDIIDTGNGQVPQRTEKRIKSGQVQTRVNNGGRFQPPAKLIFNTNGRASKQSQKKVTKPKTSKKK